MCRGAGKDACMGRRGRADLFARIMPVFLNYGKSGDIQMAEYARFYHNSEYGANTGFPPLRIAPVAHLYLMSRHTWRRRLARCEKENGPAPLYPRFWKYGKRGDIRMFGYNLFYRSSKTGLLRLRTAPYSHRADRRRRILTIIESAIAPSF